jgi:hypothetical protein
LSGLIEKQYEREIIEDIVLNDVSKQDWLSVKDCCLLIKAKYEELNEQERIEEQERLKAERKYQERLEEIERNKKPPTLAEIIISAGLIAGGIYFGAKLLKKKNRKRW